MRKGDLSPVFEDCPWKKKQQTERLHPSQSGKGIEPGCQWPSPSPGQVSAAGRPLHGGYATATSYRRRNLPRRSATLLTRPLRPSKTAADFHSLARRLWHGKATRLLSPTVEPLALENVVDQTYPAAQREAFRRIMAGMFASNKAEVVVKALRAEKLSAGSTLERRWRKLFGNVPRKRERIDACRQIAP